MSLRDVTSSQAFQFHSLEELRQWIDTIDAADHDTVQFIHGEDDSLTFHLETVRLADGSEVVDIRIPDLDATGAKR